MPAIRDALKSTIADVRNMYRDDLAALSDEALSKGFAGSARAGFDFSYEVAAVNRRVAKVLKGEEPGEWPFEGWAVAPDESRSQAAIQDDVAASLDELTAVVESMREDDFTKEITRANGDKTTALAMITFCLVHTSYHDGQLNFIQSLLGDTEVHWK